MYDIGYLYHNDLYDCSTHRNPPNYGRYANTVYSNDTTHVTNCYFDVSIDGTNLVWIVAKVDISANTEILVDYTGKEVK